MVARLATDWLDGVEPTDWLLWAQSEAAKPAILRMSDPTRAKVLAVLAGLVILGLGMILLAWLGARMTRRYMNRGADTSTITNSSPSVDDWAEKPLANETHSDDSASA